MNELNINFADILVLFRNLIKQKHEVLKQDDGLTLTFSVTMHSKM